jgi:hypothetical protein
MTTKIPHHVLEQALHFSGFIPTIHVDSGTERFFSVPQTDKNALKGNTFQDVPEISENVMPLRRIAEMFHLIRPHI